MLNATMEFARVYLNIKATLTEVVDRNAYWITIALEIELVCVINVSTLVQEYVARMLIVQL